LYKQSPVVQAQGRIATHSILATRTKTALKRNDHSELIGTAHQQQVIGSVMMSHFQSNLSTIKINQYPWLLTANTELQSKEDWNLLFTSSSTSTILPLHQ
jgi:hypothetical protein